jgi:hypothetical protein
LIVSAAPGADRDAVSEAYSNSPVQRFIKFSHQQIPDAPSNQVSREKSLYNQAHEHGWIPGPARHAEIKQWPDRVSSDPVGTERSRVLESVELYSIGEHLSSCKTVGEYIAAFYDALDSTSSRSSLSAV